MGQGDAMIRPLPEKRLYQVWTIEQLIMLTFCHFDMRLPSGILDEAQFGG